MPAPLPVFDGHNDVLLRLNGLDDPAPERAFIEGRPGGHLDLPRARAGGFAGGLFAIFVPSLEEGPGVDALMSEPPYDIPLPPGLDLTPAQRTTVRMASILFRIERASDGAVKVCRTVADIRASIDAGALAAVLHIEGAEAIDPDFQMLEVLHQAGLRSLGLVWSRNNLFGGGVPFRYPSSPDIGPGLTDLGRELVRRCNALKVLVDTSHLTERGFWDVAEVTDAPLVASHSNAHAVCAHSRNLTDRQLAAIRESGGLVGVNFATGFLRADGRRDPDTPLDDVVRHVDHLIEHAGLDCVGIGSDFDGATVPAAIGDASGLPNLIEALRRRGYDDASLRKIAHENWLRVLERTWA
jgi:membrane dipeptidase